MAEYSHRDGDAISSGFVDRGALIPQLYDKYVFGDISTGRLFYADLTDMIASNDGIRTTLAAVHELQVIYNSPYDSPDQGAVDLRLYDIVADAYAQKGGLPNAPNVLPGGAPNVGSGVLDPYGVPYGGGRADIRIAIRWRQRDLHPQQERRHDPRIDGAGFDAWRRNTGNQSADGDIPIAADGDDYGYHTGSDDLLHDRWRDPDGDAVPELQRAVFIVGIGDGECHCSRQRVQHQHDGQRHLHDDGGSQLPPKQHVIVAEHGHRDPRCCISGKF